MFFIIGVTSGTNNLGTRRCGRFSCCGTYGVMAAVTCAYQQFTFFFLPLFRFGKRYFVSCPNCGAVYEISKDEGRRIEHDFTAEINPDKIVRVVSGRAVKFCPNCGAQVNSDCRYCPNCGAKL